MANPAAAIHKRPAKQKHNKNYSKAKMYLSGSGLPATQMKERLVFLHHSDIEKRVWC